MRRFTPTNIFATAMFTLSAVILLSTFYFLLNIQVLSNWTLTFPEKEVHVGDTVVLQSSYTKVRSAGGESIRYIECKNRNGIWVRYELNRATANREAGKGGTGIVLTIRRDIADVPTTCTFSITIRYDVLPFRHVYVSETTREFRLLAEPTSARSSDAPQATTQKSQSQAATAVPVPSVNSSLPQHTAPAVMAKPNNSQPADIPDRTDTAETTDTSPSVLETITERVTNAIGRIL